MGHKRRTARILIWTRDLPGRVESVHITTSMSDYEWTLYLRQMVEVMVQARWPGEPITQEAPDCYLIGTRPDHIK